MRLSVFVVPVSVLALAFLGSPLEAEGKRAKGPEGVYWVLFPWEADFLPVGNPDGVPEQYSAPGLFTIHEDGTITDTGQDPDQQFHSYWKKTGKRTIVIKALAVGKDWRVAPEEARFTSDLLESEVTFSKGYDTFTGVQWGKTWLCPLSPWGAPSNLQCPNPITTDLPPDFETGPDDAFAFYGWRLPEP